MLTVYKKELRHLFGSMRAYAAIAIVLCVFGFYTVFGNMTGSPELSIPFIGTFPALAVAVPMITATLFSRERRGGLQALTYSYSITPVENVLGKYLATLTVMMVPTALTALTPVLYTMISDGGEIVMAKVYFAWFGYFLLGVALSAISLFISTIFDNAWINFGVGVGVLGVFYLSQLFLTKLPTLPLFSVIVIELLLAAIVAWFFFAVRSLIATAASALLPVGVAILYFVRSDWFAALLPRMIARINPFHRYVGFIYGRFDLDGIVFYLSVAALFVAASVLLCIWRRDSEF